MATEPGDITTIKLLKQAEENLEAALKTMPNKVNSVFMATDVRDLDIALRKVQIVRSDAENETERRGR